MKLYIDGNGTIWSNKDEYGGEVTDVRADIESKHSAHSDRLWQSNPEKFDECRMKVFDNHSQYFDEPSEKIEQFLCEYLQKKITLVRIVRYINASSGYPYWRFDYVGE